MSKFMRLAMEGANVEVVKGMFVAVPITDVEHVKSLATEDLSETIKNVGKKIWDIIARILASITASVKATVNWITNRAGRSLTREFTRNFALDFKKFKELKPPTANDEMLAVVKSDGLLENFKKGLNDHQKAILSDGPYAASVLKCLDWLVNQMSSGPIQESAKIIGKSGWSDDLPELNNKLTETAKGMKNAVQAAKQYLEDLETALIRETRAELKSVNHLDDLLPRLEHTLDILDRHHVADDINSVRGALIMFEDHIELIKKNIERRSKSENFNEEELQKMHRNLYVLSVATSMVIQVVNICGSFYSDALYLFKKTYAMYGEAAAKAAKVATDAKTKEALVIFASFCKDSQKR